LCDAGVVGLVGWGTSVCRYHTRGLLGLGSGLGLGLGLGSYSWPLTHTHSLPRLYIYKQETDPPPIYPPYPPFFQEMDRLYEEASRDLRPIASEKNLASRKEALARERLERAAGGTFFMTFHYVIAREGSGRHFFYDFSLCNCSRGQREALCFL